MQVIDSIVDMMDTVTDNILAISATGFAMYMLWANITIPDWYVALLGLAWAFYFKKPTEY